MTENEAKQWAIKCLTNMLSHKMVRLHIGEATQAAMAMTVLTNTVWSVSKHASQASEYYRVSDTGMARNIPANTNKAGNI